VKSTFSPVASRSSAGGALKTITYPNFPFNNDFVQMVMQVPERP